MHTHYGTIKAFKGMLEDGEQDQIHLSGGKSGTGYRIVKFELCGNKPGVVSQESVVKIYKVKPTAVDALIDFSDNGLIATGFWFNKSSVDFPVTMKTIFDNEIFNQDIYITHSEVDSTEPVNYYIELEEVKMTGPQEAVVNFSAVILNTS